MAEEMYKAHVDVTDRNRVPLYTDSILENDPVEALRRQGEIYQAAHERYGDECYVFTNWAGAAPSKHIPGSPADQEAKAQKHKPFPEEMGGKIREDYLRSIAVLNRKKVDAS